MFNNKHIHMSYWTASGIPKNFPPFELSTMFWFAEPPVPKPELYSLDDLLTLYDNTEDMAFDDFTKKLDKVACFEWCKYDSKGVFSTESYENKMDNFRELYKLPYPKKLIIGLVSFGCSRCVHSVDDICKLYEDVRKEKVRERVREQVLMLMLTWPGPQENSS